MPPIGPQTGRADRRGGRVARKRRRRTPRPPAPKPTGVSPSGGDAAQATSGDYKKAARFKRKPAYKKAIRVAYASRPLAERRQRVARAKAKRVKSTEDKAVLTTHAKRARAYRTKPGGSDAAQAHADDFQRAERFKRSMSYLEARRAARKTRYELASPAEKKRLFGNPAEDAKRPEVLRRFKAEDDRIAARNRRRLKKGVKAELEGHGKAAKFLSGLANRYQRQTKKGGGVGGTATITAFRPGKKPADLAARAVKDAINFPAQAVPSAYVPVAAAVEAAKGRPQRAKRYLKDIDKSDPIYNLGAAAVDAVQGKTKSAGKRLARAGKAASEHPGYTAIEAAGIKGSIGRGTGRVMRTGIVGKKARRAASTSRTVQAVEGTKIVRKRAYSPDVIKKGRQVSVEKVRRARAKQLRGQADRAASPAEKAALQHKADKANPDRITPHEIRRRVDERVDANETVRRARRAKAVNEAREAVKPAKKHGTLVNLVTQGIVKADRHDIESYVRELEAEHPKLDRAGKRANKQLRHDITTALKSADLTKVKEASHAYAKTVRPKEDALVQHGILDADQAEMSRLMPYAVRRMGAMHDGDRLVDPSGDTLHADAIRAHMAEHMGTEHEPVFLSQAPNARGARNYYVSSSKAPSAGIARRTGEATRKGTFDAHPDTLNEQAARAQGLHDAHEGFVGFVDEFAARRPDTKRVRAFVTKKRAIAAAKAMRLTDAGGPKAGAIEWVPVRINPFGGSKGQLSHLLEDVNTGSETLHEHAGTVDHIIDALQAKGDEGPYALVPKAAAQRMEEHMRVLKPGTTGKVGGAVNSAFRRTVLATSLPWFLGNISEGTMRTALAGAGPRSYLTGHRLTKSLAESGHDEALARMLPGGHFNAAERQRIHRDVSQFEDTHVEPIARALSAFWRAPGPKQVADVWHHWTQAVFQTVNGRIERQFQTAMLGKAVRGSDLMEGHVLKLSRKALEQAEQGLRNTNEQVAFGREVDRMYGRYGKYSPDGRKAIALYTPFIAWTLNAVRFITQVLPQDHPVVTSLIAQAELATDEWRKQHGLDKFIKGAVPGWLQGSVPGAGNVKFRGPSRYTPFGAFSDLPETLASSVLPQASGVLEAGKGRDWTGKELKKPSGEPADDLDKAKAAALSLFGGTVPFFTLAQTVARKGPQKYITDSVTGRTAPKPKKARKTKASSGFGGGSSASGFSSSSSSGGFK